MLLRLPLFRSASGMLPDAHADGCAAIMRKRAASSRRRLRGIMVGCHIHDAVTTTWTTIHVDPKPSTYS